MILFDLVGLTWHLLSLWQFFSPGVHLRNCGGGDVAMHDGHVDAGLLERVPVLQDAGDATAALGPGPTVNLKFGMGILMTSHKLEDFPLPAFLHNNLLTLAYILID